MSQNNTYYRHIILMLISALTLSFGLSAKAQTDEAVYDPFIDYSEFEEAGEEEADINFFRNGRLLTAALLVGQRQFTEGMKDAIDSDATYGFQFNYFFDLNFALQFSYMLGKHGYVLTNGTQTVRGDIQLNSFGLGMKYYFNMQNVTKGLSGFNPYLSVGFSNNSRESKRAGQTEFAKESATGIDFSAGFEVPVLRNEMFLGAQAQYQLVSFDNENTQYKVEGVDSGRYLNGDIINITLIMGKNF